MAEHLTMHIGMLAILGLLLLVGWSWKLQSTYSGSATGEDVGTWWHPLLRSAELLSRTTLVIG